jgi:hypothetical protein
MRQPQLLLPLRHLALSIRYRGARLLRRRQPPPQLLLLPLLHHMLLLPRNCRPEAPCSVEQLREAAASKQ